MIKFILRHLCRLFGSIVSLLALLFTVGAVHATLDLGAIPLKVTALAWILAIATGALGWLMVRHAPVAPKIQFGRGHR